MQLEHSFTVPVGVDQAWEVLLDIERIAPCMPGAAIESVDGDDFTGSVKVKLGPIGLTYKGKASFTEKDAAAHKAVIKAQGRDSRGNGTANATITATLVEVSGSTEVKVTTDLDITGKPAQFGRGVMVDVGNKLIGQFADCLSRKLGEDTPSSGAHAAPEAAPETPAAEGAPADAAASDTASAEAAASGAASAGPTPAKKAPAKKAAAKAPAKKVAAAATSGATTSAAVNGAAAASESAAAAPAPRKIAPAPEVEPIDLMASAGPAVAKRLAPVVGGVVLLLIILRLLRRR